MLTRRVTQSARPLSGTNPLIRTFASTTPASATRAPSIGNIKSDSAATFAAKQKEFRTKTAERKKTGDASQSRAAKPSSSSPSANTVGEESSLALGSLSTSPEQIAASSSDEPTKKKGPLSSLIYGTKEGRQMDKEMEHSYSEVLARGKYVHSIVFHEVKPDKVDEYVELVGSWYPKMAGMPENKVNLVGSWRTDVGDCDTFGMSISGWRLTATLSRHSQCRCFV